MALVAAALYLGQELLIPLVLAGLLAFILAPLIALLTRLRAPRVLAVLLAVTVAFLVIGALGAVLARQAGQLAQHIPEYQADVMEKWRTLSASGGLLDRLTGGALTSPSLGGLFEMNTASILALVQRLAQPLLGPLATTGIVLVFTLFILLYSEDLRDRFVRLVGRRDLHRTILALTDAGRRLSRYFLFQVLLNTAFGTLIAISLHMIGLPGSLLWGIVAGIMRFVPFIGTFIAVAAPLALSIAVAPDWTMPLIVFALFVGADLVIGQIVEPLLYGHSTGLSPIAIVLATGIWALFWGPIGLLIATPLTVCLVVLGRHVDAFSFIDVIFGDAPPLEPSETFYQRALEGRALSLLGPARHTIAASSPAEYFDAVALPGLALAQADRARDVLAFERLEAVHEQITTLLDALALDTDASDAPAMAWREPAALLFVPGRGPFDDLTAHMARKAFAAAGFGAMMQPNAVLAGAPRAELDGVRVCCLCVLEDGASAASIRYFVRRIQKTMPRARIVIGLWMADAESSLLASLRMQGGEEHIVLSLSEMLAFARAVSNRVEPIHA